MYYYRRHLSKYQAEILQILAGGNHYIRHNGNMRGALHSFSLCAHSDAPEAAKRYNNKPVSHMDVTALMTIGALTMGATNSFEATDEALGILNRMGLTAVTYAPEVPTLSETVRSFVPNRMYLQGLFRPTAYPHHPGQAQISYRCID